MSGIQLHNITVMRGARRTLDDVSVGFAPGKLTAVIGPNGAGKSTLLNVAVGLLKPHAGNVTLDGRPLKDYGTKSLAKLRAYLPQRAGVEWPITVERVVALGLTPALPVFGDLPPDMLGAVNVALEACDLGSLRTRKATELSGGELARVMLARAIVGDPHWLIVDEPTAGLDPRHAIDAVKRLRQRADAGHGVIMAIHDLDLALNHADAVIALRDGRVIAAGPIAEAVSAEMLGALYDVPVRLQRDADGLSIRFVEHGSKP